MPNGGSDCCGTCWFNRRNGGEAGYPEPDAEPEESHCDIRDVTIEDPFWTYCANHPHRRPERDPIPIGPITRQSGGGVTNDREVWIPSPDSEEIRLHLLRLLEEFVEHPSSDGYPIGDDLGEVVLWQLGEFRERRAEEYVRWVAENLPDPWEHVARSALDRIGGDG